MSTLVIITHPEMHISIVNRMWKEALIEADIDVVDLYELYPDSKLDVSKEQQRLLKYDKVIFQFPFYWYSSPPLLKQYFDEVFLFNYAYGPEGTKLNGKLFGLAVTVGSPESDYTAEGFNKFTLNELLTPFESTFHYVGAKYIGYFAQFGTVNHATESELREGTKRYIEFVNRQYER
ncbi:NAD(P)H-dependent oxidoreductase [Macrococcoides bohemicum]|uniref:NAD(P)H-dependent oxidoreductase n=1 Tax=Macrococcoides bohemicum TaxID=1903056 RepID=UPI00165D3FD3|nr:NAD(P)H-dependent oxidoreductase [Macrococcus bohemicus]MBC9874465.1 NAD(P)H-dependent oxidoreductase [Macrococcus bohemicus]